MRSRRWLPLVGIALATALSLAPCLVWDVGHADHEHHAYDHGAAGALHQHGHESINQPGATELTGGEHRAGCCLESTAALTQRKRQFESASLTGAIASVPTGAALLSRDAWSPPLEQSPRRSSTMGVALAKLGVLLL